MDWNMYNKDLISFFFNSHPHIGVSIFFKKFKTNDVSFFVYYEVIFLVGAWLNPLKPKGLHISHLHLKSIALIQHPLL